MHDPRWFWDHLFPSPDYTFQDFNWWLEHIDEFNGHRFWKRDDWLRLVGDMSKIAKHGFSPGSATIGNIFISFTPAGPFSIDSRDHKSCNTSGEEICILKNLEVLDIRYADRATDRSFAQRCSTYPSNFSDPSLSLGLATWASLSSSFKGQISEKLWVDRCLSQVGQLVSLHWTS